MPPVVERFKKTIFTRDQVLRRQTETLKLRNVTSCVLNENGTDEDGDPAYILTTQYTI